MVPGGIRAALRALSWGYLAGLNAVVLAHRVGVRSCERAACPVIGIGNLTVGGTGKSTAVATIALWLRQAGLRPAVVSRGHGGRAGAGAHIVGDGERLLLGAKDAGDEAVMLARRLAGVPVVVARRRPLAVAAAIRLGANVCLLDDAFQVRNLVKDLEIVLLESAHAFDNGFVLPRGMLREPPSRLSRAHAVVLMEPQRCRPQTLASAQESVAALAPGACLAQARRVPERLRPLDGGDDVPLDALRGMRVASLSAIGHPAGFEALLRELGADVIPLRFRDHHRYGPADLERAECRACDAGAQAIVTTEKDAVKLSEMATDPAPAPPTPAWGWKGGSAGPSVGPSLPTERGCSFLGLPVWVLRIRLGFLEGEDELRARVLAAAMENAA